MEILKLETEIKKKSPTTALLYCAPGIGKSTTLGLIAEKSKGRTLVLDVDRTFISAMAKGDVVKDLSRVDVVQIDNVNTWSSWIEVLRSLKENSTTWENIAVDNISELERCMLADLGRQGKNKGIPGMADYQCVQIKLVDSLRTLRNFGRNVYLTAWETTEQFTNPDGSSYTRAYPKIMTKIVDNICGLCDIVGRVTIGKEGARGIILEATQNVYAKNQRDVRKWCLANDF